MTGGKLGSRSRTIIISGEAVSPGQRPPHVVCGGPTRRLLNSLAKQRVHAELSNPLSALLAKSLARVRSCGAAGIHRAPASRGNRWLLRRWVVGVRAIPVLPRVFLFKSTVMPFALKIGLRSDIPAPFRFVAENFSRIFGTKLVPQSRQQYATGYAARWQSGDTTRTRFKFPAATARVVDGRAHLSISLDNAVTACGFQRAAHSCCPFH